MHIFGPYGRYPLSPGRGYTPPEASIAMYQEMLSTIGLSRTVVVQPSIYGTDNAVSLDAVAALGADRARAVVVVDDSFDLAALRAMGARGACGVRFNAVSGNGTPLEQLEALGEKLATLGWHLQLYAHAAEMVALEAVLARLPCPVVIDHMGGVKAAEGGIGSPGFKAMIRLLEKGAWAKLCGYRSSAAGAPYADVAGHGPRHDRRRAGPLRLGHRLAASVAAQPGGSAGRRRAAGRARRLGAAATTSARRSWWTTRRGSTASEGRLSAGLPPARRRA